MVRFSSGKSTNLQIRPKALAPCCLVLAALGVASAARAGCQDDLAAVDAAMAYVELDGEPLNYLLARRAQAGELCTAGDEAAAKAPIDELKFMTGLIAYPVSEEEGQ
jgi:hypothetical protein